MKIDYLENIMEGGKFREAVSENLIRIWDFTPQEMGALRSLILTINGPLDLGTIDFITMVNCTLILHPHSEDLGLIKTEGSSDFICYLSPAGFAEMMDITEPFENGAEGYNWVDAACSESIYFLISPGGTW